jgi:DNA-binding transcriptional LysR family regulator
MIEWWLTVVSSKPEFDSLARIMPNDLAGEPLILSPPDHTSRQLVEHHFRRAGLIPRVIHETRSTEVELALVRAGYGTAILPSDALQQTPSEAGIFISPQTGGNHSLFWFGDRTLPIEIKQIMTTFEEVRNERGLLNRPSN